MSVFNRIVAGLTMKSPFPASVLALFLILSCVGCHGDAKAAKAKAEKVHTGMTISEVEAILGTGETKSRSYIRQNSLRVEAETGTWMEGKARIVVTFVEDKATVINVLEE
jgi:hypothetical protein